MKLLVTALGAGLLLSSCTTDGDVDSIESNIGNSELNNLPRHFPTNNAHSQAGGGGGGGSLVNHGGPTITNAHVVTIFWGAEWTTQSGAALLTSINNYVAAFGTTGEYNTITQYSGIQKSSLAAGTWTDLVNPVPTNATDAEIQAEVGRYVAANGFDASAIYEVFLPSTSYSSDGTSTSCGGPNLAYCAYHGNFAGVAGNTRYASMPYPSCGGCTTSTFSVAQNFEHFISHETREAVTDPDGTGWWDRRGYEADDKCAWSPTPFADASTGTNSDGTAFAYQYEWSNANGGCIKTR
jgi:hypothetical protein